MSGPKRLTPGTIVRYGSRTAIAMIVKKDDPHGVVYNAVALVSSGSWVAGCKVRLLSEVATVIYAPVLEVA